MSKKIIIVFTAVLLALLIPAALSAGTKDAALDAALNVEGGELTFVSEGAYPWQTAESDDADHAVFGICGNTGTASSTSVMTLSVTVGEEGSGLSFDYQAFGESSNYGYVFDHCIFKIDGAVQFDKGNEYDAGWQTFETNLEPGAHTLEWSYTKDSSVNAQGDYFAVDNVSIGDVIPDEPDPTEPPVPTPEPPTETQPPEPPQDPTEPANP